MSLISSSPFWIVIPSTSVLLMLDDVSRSLSAVASVLRKSIETENERGQSDRDSQQNKGGSRLHDETSEVQELQEFRSSELQNQIKPSEFMVDTMRSLFIFLLNSCNSCNS